MMRFVIAVNLDEIAFVYFHYYYHDSYLAATYHDMSMRKLNFNEFLILDMGHGYVYKDI